LESLVNPLFVFSHLVHIFRSVYRTVLFGRSFHDFDFGGGEGAKKAMLKAEN